MNREAQHYRRQYGNADNRQQTQVHAYNSFISKARLREADRACTDYLSFFEKSFQAS